MKISILDDYQDAIRTLKVYSKVAGHEVQIWNDHTKDTDELARRLADTETLVVIRERTPIRAPLIERLPKLRLISQYSVYLPWGRDRALIDYPPAWRTRGACRSGGSRRSRAFSRIRVRRTSTAPARRNRPR
jgi:hypothetical protein